VHRVLAGAVDRVVLGGEPLAEVALLAAHRDGAGVDDTLDAGQPAGLEAVVHAENVQLHDLVGIALAGAEAVGEVDHAFGLDLEDEAHHVLEVRDVAAHHRTADGLAVEGDGARIEIHAHHRLAACDQLANEAWSDEPGGAEHEHRHVDLSLADGLIVAQTCVYTRAPWRPGPRTSTSSPAAAAATSATAKPRYCACPPA
jgi:hypothetical protein